MNKRFIAIVFVALFAALMLVQFSSAQSPAPPPVLNCGNLPPGIAATITAQEPWYCPINDYVTQSFQPEALVAILAVMIAFAIAAIIFIVGVVLKLDRVRNFGIGELWEAMASALIVGLFLYLCAVIFGVIPGLFVGAVNPYATALNSISITINAAETMYANIYTGFLTDSFYVSLVTGLDGGTSRNPAATALTKLAAVIGVNIVGIYSGAVSFLYLEPATIISGILIDGIATLYVFYFVIIFFAAASIPAFLVPGIIFRAFLPTRALGGVLISLAVVFYLVMPLLFSISFAFSTHAGSPLSTLSELSAKLSADETSHYGGTVTGTATPDGAIIKLLPTIENALSGLWLMLLLYPAIIIAICYAVIVQLSQFIGGIAPGMGSFARII